MTLGSGFYEVDIATNDIGFAVFWKIDDFADKFVSIAAWHVYGQENWVKTASPSDFSPSVSANFLTTQMPSPSYHTDNDSDDCILIDPGQE